MTIADDAIAAMIRLDATLCHIHSEQVNKDKRLVMDALQVLAGIQRECSVYTVGDEASYDDGLNELGDQFKKTGRTADYEGGYACRTIIDARRLITELGRDGHWAVYELAADWYHDTKPSCKGWWHSLVNDSVILRKV